VYSREINDEIYTFGVSGKLIRNVLVMFDRETDTLWSQLLGEAVQGELIGTKLEFLPSWMMTWSEWKTIHPDTVALDKGFRRGGSDTYDSYYASPATGVIGETILDDRLDAKEFVIGVELERAAIAYPFAEMAKTPVVNDVVADNPLLVVYNEGSRATAVYLRIVDDQLLTFTPVPDDPNLVQDEQTGTRWNGFTGMAIEGPLAGNLLTRVKSTSSFWFGWKDFHPGTLLYSAP
jgi:hypothetical protein